MRDVMSRATEILKLLEATERVLYFGSSKQGLKKDLKNTLTPKKPQSAHAEHIKRSSVVYASDEKAYAAAFTFKWSEEEGFEFGKYGETGIYTLKIPHKYLSRIKKPCSLYTVKGDFTKLRTGTPEYISREPVKIMREKKYSSAEECMEKNGVRIRVVQVSKRGEK